MCLCVRARMPACSHDAQGSQARALTFTLHHLRAGVPSRGHLHIFERQIEKKEKGGGRGKTEGGCAGRKEKKEGERRDRWRGRGVMERVGKGRKKGREKDQAGRLHPPPPPPSSKMREEGDLEGGVQGPTGRILIHICV